MGIYAVGEKLLLENGDFVSALQALRSLVLADITTPEEELEERASFDTILILIAVSLIINLLFSYPLFMSVVNGEAEAVVDYIYNKMSSGQNNNDNIDDNKMDLEKASSHSGSSNNDDSGKKPLSYGKLVGFAIIRMITCGITLGIVLSTGCNIASLGMLVSLVGGTLNTAIVVILPMILHAMLDRVGNSCVRISTYLAVAVFCIAVASGIVVDNLPK